MYNLEETQCHLIKQQGEIKYETENYSGIAMYIVNFNVVC